MNTGEEDGGQQRSWVGGQITGMKAMLAERMRRLQG